MSSEEIRSRFVNFFKNNGHAIVPSSSLVPADPSVLLTTAGMQQFKPYFTGESDPQKDFGAMRAASIQKCFRTSDIEEVGDQTHLTLFEMLGNFSFGYKPGQSESPKGAYFKKEAINFAYRFLTEELGLKISYVTVFSGSKGVEKDEESKRIWRALGVKDIREQGMEDVFWGPTGSSGPCGPTTEIYLKTAQGSDVEVWNIVFNQFFYNGSREDLLAQNPEKSLTPLSGFGIDTGMGLERLLAITQGVSSIYETDLFSPILAKISEMGKSLPERERRIIADHIRSSIFLAADGVRPSNKDAGYILRRLIRRMVAIRVKFDIHPSLFSTLYPAVLAKFGGVYPELKNSEVVEVLEEEQAKFEKVIPTGLLAVKKLNKKLTAKEAFQVVSTTGLPFELMQELCPGEVSEINKHDYEREVKKHQELSRAGKEAKFGGHGLYLKTGEVTVKDKSELEKVTKLHTATHLMHAALRAVLGNEVRQNGSDITFDRTRFDFNFSRKLTEEEKKKVEDMVNDVIRKDLPVGYVEMDREAAEKTGALYFFKQKYPDRVKVYYVGRDMESAFSKEFCGGPHVERTGLIGKFKIQKEEAASAGVRRIRAIIE